MPPLNTDPRRRTLVLLGTACVLFALALAGTIWILRNEIRAEMIQRDAAVFESVLEFQMESTGAEREEALDAAPFDLLVAVLSVADLRGVEAVQTFDPSGLPLESVPLSLEQQPLTGEESVAVFSGRTHVRFRPDGLATTNSALPEKALLEIHLPLEDDLGTLGVARLLIDGRELALQFQGLDRRLLALYAGVLGTFLLVVLVTALVYSRWLERTRKTLAHRTLRLRESENELLLTARTSAVGAVSAQLIHDLRGGLSGLKAFLKDPLVRSGEAASEDWAIAMESLAELERLVSDTVELIRSGESDSDEPWPVAAIGPAVQERFEEPCRRHGIILEIDLATAASERLNARTASLTVLALSNLLNNAVRALGPGGFIRVDAQRSGPRTVTLRVRDNGPGLPAELVEKLFRPKEGSAVRGSGIGLAIARQLLRAAGGHLALGSTGPGGTVFEITVTSDVSQSSRKKEIKV